LGGAGLQACIDVKKLAGIWVARAFRPALMTKRSLGL